MSSFDGITQAYLIEGIRGSGKTVLMTMCSAELASQGNWTVIDLNSSRELLTDLAEKMSSAMQKIPASVQTGGKNEEAELKKLFRTLASATIMLLGGKADE